MRQQISQRGEPILTKHVNDDLTDNLVIGVTLSLVTYAQHIRWVSTRAILEVYFAGTAGRSPTCLGSARRAASTPGLDYDTLQCMCRGYETEYQ
jgi:hypothetical protein